MPSEITHKSAFSPMRLLGALVAMWVFGYLVGINNARSEPTMPEPSRTIHVTPSQ
ncbi:hypothetical protein [Saccharopolyspora pogona]|uniref:hypothetical protein n=1 Tax=Saccharopolyspora pogona TaxID=333966 RepID=UPI0016832875|nr:hypothetical protein [Saccharopolyspora pogona]